MQITNKYISWPVCCVSAAAVTTAAALTVAMQTTDEYWKYCINWDNYCHATSALLQNTRSP